MSILDHRILTGLVRKVRPVKMMAAPLFGTPRPVFGKSVGVDILTGSTGIVPYRHPGAPAGGNDKMVRGHINVELPHISERKFIEADDLVALRRPGTEHEPWAQEMILAELEDLRAKVERRVEATRWDLLTDGAASLPVEYEGGTSGTLSIDFQMAATHILDYSGAAWDTTTNPVLTHIKNAKSLLNRDGYNQGGSIDAYVSHADVFLWMALNDDIQTVMDEVTKKDFMGRGTDRGDGLLFQGITWHLVEEGYWSGATFIPYVGGADAQKWIVFKRGERVGDEFEGPVADVDRPAGQTGFFSKMYSKDDPSGAYLHVKYRGIPVLSRPDDLVSMRVK